MNPIVNVVSNLERNRMELDENLKIFLEEKLGLTLLDDGRYWRTTAMFRGGSNPMSVRISKDTGYFSDFGSDTKGGLKKLVSLIAGETENVDIEKFIQQNHETIREKKINDSKKVRQEKVFDKEVLDLMFPNYSFYNKRGISSETLKRLGGGLFQEWKMYLRFCFPIYNEDGNVIGFSGRDITDTKKAKWKKLGKSYNWIYPLFVPVNGELFFLNEVEKKREVIIVESIGDMLSLHEAGLFNVVVTFGTTFSDTLFSYLSALSVSRVIIATNNDFEKGEGKNTGAEFSLKIFLRFCSFLGSNGIEVHLPTKKDFGEMSVREIEEWYRLTKSIDKGKMYANLLSMLRKFYKKNPELFKGKVIRELKSLQERI